MARVSVEGIVKRYGAVAALDEVSLDFEDHPFEVNTFTEPCALCGATGVYLDEIVTDNAGGRMYCCSDTDYCAGRRNP